MKKLRWGLIGCGDIARKRVAPALRDAAHSELAAVSRADFARAESFAREFGAQKWYRDWRELCADREIDAVYIATPVNLHVAQAVAAAEAGKHVLVEKPMAMDAHECDQIIDAGRAHDVRIGVAYYRHFYPVVGRVREILNSGEIGEPVVAQINAFEQFNPAPGHPRHWLVQKEVAGGGPMFDFGCHRIEVLMNILGEIKQVAGVTSNAVFERDVEDTGVAALTFERGACGVVTVTHAAREPQDTLTLFGSRGTIHVAVLNDGKLIVKSGDGVREESHPPAANLHQPLIEDFVDAVLNGREPGVGGRAGREVARVEEAIYR